jgi:hypothetical protein
MSATTALGIMPNQRPIKLTEFRNAHGWSMSIWNRLVKANYGFDGYVLMGEGERHLDRLWQSIEELPEWQQAPLILTFDTGIIPWQAYQWAAEQFDEFERRLSSPEHHVNHVPAMADLLRSGPEVPWFGVWGTSVTDNPFDPWDYDADEPGSGLAFEPGVIYVLERHRHLLPTPEIASR